MEFKFLNQMFIFQELYFLTIKNSKVGQTLLQSSRINVETDFALSVQEIEACCDNLNVLVVKLVDCICTSTTCTVMYLCGEYMTTLVVIICILN